MPWRHVAGWPSQLTAIHAVHLHNNRVMMWGYGDSNSDRDCKAWILNLVTGEFFQVDCSVNNIFCAGHAMLADGRVLIAGGTDSRQGENGEGFGTRYATLLVPDASLPGAHWEEGQPMGSTYPDDARWYPTNTSLPDGRQLVVSGTTQLVPPPFPPRPPGTRSYNKKVQVFNSDDAQPWFTALIEQQLPLYPAMFVIPSGLVFYAGRGTQDAPFKKTLALRLTDFTWHDVTLDFDNGAIGEHNSVCSFSPGKILRCGGNVAEGNPNASALAAVIDLSNWQVNQPAAWQSISPMNFPRRDHNLVMLPGMRVLAIGGQESSDYTRPVMQPEVFDLNDLDGEWVLLDAPPDLSYPPRMYHSTAILLPSGEVLVAGGQQNESTTYPSGDIYTPPYIAGSTLDRPMITSAPSQVQYNTTFPVAATVASGRTAVEMCLISYACVTHGFDQNQRYIPLAFSQSGLGGYDVVAPPNTNHAPPGYYMLFVADNTGSYSTAAKVHLAA
ncbi:MAG: hypothetical protein KatS3mg015_1458 [Fimbriimonadales bacterium]|nr:MAG: hypothetical protein KatS3mg015_1458 [Fimbriimonadales bacterium]